MSRDTFFKYIYIYNVSLHMTESKDHVRQDCIYIYILKIKRTSAHDRVKG